MIIAGLTVLAGVNLYNYFTPSLSHEVMLQQVGGKENLEKLHTYFETDSYKTAQKERYEQTMKFLEEENEQAPTVNNDTGNELESEAVLEALAKYKEVNKFVHGPENARFTILEFSELLCPFCKRHHNDGTLQSVIDKFPGEVNTINIGYLVHGQAQKLQEGLLCATEQKDAKTYYEFIGKLFEESSLSPDTLLEVAKRLGYDADAMKKCMEDGKYADTIAEQTSSARSLFGVTGTPGNVIIDTETGKYSLVSGAYPVGEFVSQIEALKASK